MIVLYVIWNDHYYWQLVFFFFQRFYKDLKFKVDDSPIIFEFLPLYFIKAFRDIKMKFSFRFVSYLGTFISQIISVFRGRLPRNEIQNVPFRCVETSVILLQVATTWNKIHLKFIRSYLLDIKIVLYQPPRGCSLILLRTSFQPMRHPSCSKITIPRLDARKCSKYPRKYFPKNLSKWSIQIWLTFYSIISYRIKISKRRISIFQNHACKIQK